MEKLTQEEFEFLSKYEDRLNSAKTANYTRAIPSGVVHRMREIYSRLIDKYYSMSESCGRCILTLLIKLYTPYYEYKQTIEGDSARCSTESEQDNGTSSGGKEQTADSGSDN